MEAAGFPRKPNKPGLARNTRCIIIGMYTIINYLGDEAMAMGGTIHRD